MYLDTYFVKDFSDVHTKYSEEDVIKMLKFHIDSIHMDFSGQIFHPPLPADFFLYGYEAEFNKVGLLK